jgi:hypothetical protein
MLALFDNCHVHSRPNDDPHQDDDPHEDRDSRDDYLSLSRSWPPRLSFHCESI